MGLQIGTRLNQIRKEKNISIARLSEESGVSTGLISQIERELVTPSVVNLWKIAKALDTNINYFFEEEENVQKTIIRAGEHKVIKAEEGRSIYELFSPADGSRQLDLIKVTLKAGEEYEKELLVHDGEECGMAIKGEVTVCIKDEEFVLHEGDSIYFKSEQPHKYVNRSDKECVSIWAMTPSFF